MTHDQFEESMKRILAVFTMKEEQAAGYVETIFESVGWMDGYYFDQACKEIVARFKVGARKPLPVEFKREYAAAQARANVPGAVSTSRCEPCGATGWRLARYRRKNGEEVDAVWPCANCRKEAAQAARLKPDLEFMFYVSSSEERSETIAWCNDRIGKMSALGVERALEAADKLKVNLWPEVVAALTTRHAELSAATPSAPVAVAAPSPEHADAVDWDAVAARQDPNASMGPDDIF